MRTPSSRSLLLVTVLALTACAGRNRSSAEPQLAGGESPAAFHRAIGMTLVRTGQPRRALPYLQRLVRLEPDRPEPLCDLARAFMDLGMWPQARGAIDQAIARAPRYPAAHALRGVLLDSLGDHAAAQLDHQRAIDLDPASAAYHNNLGFSRYLDGKFPQALAALTAAVRLEPGLRRVHNNLGFVYGALGRVDLAGEQFRISGGAGEASNNLGLVHEARGELEQAYQAYLEAVGVAPELVEPRANLERVRGRLGKPASALPDRRDRP
jgi:protein O-GlcNAc transferase